LEEMKQRKVSLDIGHLKPVMKSLRTIEDIPIAKGTVVSAKVDGEFTLANFGNGCYMVNGWGKLREDFPALNELESALRREGLSDAQLLCEFYATREDGAPAKLPEFIHIAKGKDTDHTRLRLGVWDLILANGKKVGDYGWKMDEVSEWLRGCRYCHVLPYIKPTKRSEIRTFWKEHVVEGGYEGVVARLNNDIYKVKPIRDVDAVIIAINKRELFKEQKVTSFKVALMDEDRSFVVLSDVASGIDHELRTALWKLMEFRVNEDDDAVYVRPVIVCKVEYQETFPRDTPKLMFDGKEYRETGIVEFFSLRHPRFKRFRSDKMVNPTDLRLSQIALEEELSVSLYIDGNALGRGLSEQQKRILLMLEFTQRKDDPKYGWFSTQEIICDRHHEYFLWLRSWRSEPFSTGPWDNTRLRRHESKRISVSRALRSLEKRGLVVSYIRKHNRFWAIPKRVNRAKEFMDRVFDEMNWVETPEERELRRKIWSWAWYRRRLDAMTRIRLKFGLLDETDKEELEKIHQDYKDFWEPPEHDAPLEET